MQPEREYERKLQQLERRSRKRRTNYRFLFLLIVLGLFVLMLVELGRTLAYSQEIGQFIQNIDEKTPTEVKAALDRYARGFNDHNPVIRRASMTVFKFATGETFGADRDAWKRWWLENKNSWEYQPSPPPSVPETGSREGLTPIPVPDSRPRAVP